MSMLSYRKAVNLAIAEEMRRDSSVVLIGEDVAAAGGVFKVTEGLYEEFGPGRVRDTPISEQAIVGAAIGAALNGLRPIVELMFADFVGVAFDQVANQLAKYRYMTGGQARVPVTIRMASGAGVGFGPQHSQMTENWVLNVPGLVIVVPGTPSDVRGLLKSAIRSDNPVLVFEHKNLYGLEEDVLDEDVLVPLGTADVVTAGSDITLVATQQARQIAQTALAELQAMKVSVELIDPRCLAPFDWKKVFDSVQKTGRLLVVEEGPSAGSWGEMVVARVSQELFDQLVAAPTLISSPATPVPFAGNLEAAWLPKRETIIAAAAAMCSHGKTMPHTGGSAVSVP